MSNDELNRITKRLAAAGIPPTQHATILQIMGLQPSPPQIPTSPDGGPSGRKTMSAASPQHNTGHLATLQDMILAAHAAGDPDLARWLAEAADKPALLAKIVGQ